MHRRNSMCVEWSRSTDPAESILCVRVHLSFENIDIYVEIESHRCGVVWWLFKHTNVHCIAAHCASTISRITLKMARTLKRYSKQHRYSTLSTIFWKSHMTSGTNEHTHTHSLTGISSTFISRDDHVLKEWCALNAQFLSGINHTQVILNIKCVIDIAKENMLVKCDTTGTAYEPINWW